ncbi:hypothetical protein EVAR_74858_1 [Eumeta japonica]|uniref:Uncharacterized protein n=1 Tax=Eumeta variegata TaxID=151549 RepID=A0A4C1SPS7_EUMVA|nr:hypothetical protein EVAR_74858_1 [Eumeta japonica]
MGPPDGGRPIPIRKITNWKRVLLPTTSGQWSRRASGGIPDRRKFPPDILELIRAKRSLRRASAYPTPEYRSRARALNAK